MAAKVSRSPRTPASSARAMMAGCRLLLQTICSAAWPRCRRRGSSWTRSATPTGVYLVGGAVRDLLRGDAPVDLDLVADRELGELIAELSGAGGASGARPRAFRHGHARARWRALRSRPRPPRATIPIPGRCLEVEPAAIEEDLRRRDFTVNALALGLGGARRGELLAVPGALDDLGTGTLRVLHDASFRDDPTRLLRLARYAGRLGFAPDEHTAGLAGKAIDDGALATVSGARLGTELRLLAAEADPQSALEELHRLGIDEALIPGMAAPDREVLARALELLPADGDRAALVAGGGRARSRPGPAGARPRRAGVRGWPAGRDLRRGDRAPALARQLAAARRPSEIAEAAAGAPVEAVALAGAIGRRGGEGGRAALAGGTAPRRPGDQRQRPGGGGGDTGAGDRRRVAGGAVGSARRPGERSRRAACRGAAARRGRRLASVLPAPFTELGEHFAIDLPGARAVFTTRRGGHSVGPYASLNLGFATDDDPEAMARNRAALPAAIGSPEPSFTYQVHGAEVRRITAETDPARDRGERPRVDGQATNLPGVAMAALVADCLPVAVAGGGAVAMLHAGWRGLQGGVIAAGVRAVRELGAGRAGRTGGRDRAGRRPVLLRGRRRGPRGVRRVPGRPPRRTTSISRRSPAASCSPRG